MYYLQTRYYDPAIGRFINADSFATTNALDILSCNMFAYCENNPSNNCDPTGALAFPGEIHNQVVRHVADDNELMREQIILYDNGFWGRADLVSQNGEIWDVKRNKPRQIAKGVEQVLGYTKGTWKAEPTVVLKVGGKLEGGSFTYQSGLTTYHVSYNYVGKGIIAYDYKTEIKAKTIASTAAAIICIAFLGYLTCQSGGITAPAFVQAIEYFAK